MFEYMRTVLNGLKAWVTGEVNKLLSKIDNDIAALRKTLDEASSDFVINATITSESELATLDKTFAQIQEAINAGKTPIVLLNNKAYLPIVGVDTRYIAFSSASSDKSESYVCTLYVYPDQESQIDYVYSVGLNPDKTMPQLYMDADPTSPMEIATKKYVDDHATGGMDMGITGASVGQIAKITSVDASGAPTAWSSVDMASGADGKSAYAYAQDGGYTKTEAEFAEKLAQEPLIGTTRTLTPTQVYDAVSAGVPVKVQYTDSTYGLSSFTAFNVSDSMNVIASNSIVNYQNSYLLAVLYGNKSNNIWFYEVTTLAKKTDIPTDDHINSLIDTKLGVIENGSY